VFLPFFPSYTADERWWVQLVIEGNGDRLRRGWFNHGD
jgi:hypothetical protein